MRNVMDLCEMNTLATAWVARILCTIPNRWTQVVGTPGGLGSGAGLREDFRIPILISRLEYDAVSFQDSQSLISIPSN